MSELKLNDFIKAYKEIKKQNFIVDNIDKDFFLEFAECFIKKVKELETENYIQRKIIMSAYDRGWIPKQKIKDKIEKLKQIRRELGFKTYLKREHMLNEDREIVIKIQVLQELLQESEDRNAN